MSKDANSSVAAAGKETRNALLVGLLLLLLLILAPVYWVERAQQDLTERSRVALRSGGLDPDAFAIGFDGRDAKLVGSQAQAAQLGQARRLVERVWGVRTVSTRATAADAVAPAGTTATAAQEPSTGGLVDGPMVPPSSDAAPPPPAEARSEQTAASVEPAPAPPPDPEPASTKVAPQPAEVPVAAPPLAPRPADRARELAAAEPVAPETTATPASEQEALLPPTTPGPAMLHQEALAEPAATGPAAVESRAQAETLPGEFAQEPVSRSAAASPETGGAETGTPPAPAATPPSPEPLSPASRSVGAEAEPPGSKQEPVPEKTTAAAGGAPRAGARELSADTLLSDWPDLAAVEGLRLEMQQEQVWLRGQVNSLADLERIEAQFPASAAARHVQLDLQLADRSAQELADYLNLVAASFRFRAGTSHFGPAGERAMDRIADTLKSYPGTRLGLLGWAPETIKPQVRRVHARHRAGATYRALLKRGVDGQQLFLADFASPFSALLSRVPLVPSGPGQIQFFSLER